MKLLKCNSHMNLMVCNKTINQYWVVHFEYFKAKFCQLNN